MEVDKKAIDTQIRSTSFNLEAETSEENPRLGNCEVCAFHDAKYTCPKCEVKTCSLKCNKLHKLELECDGVRDRAKFIPLNKFSNLDLSNDYKLMEEITRNIEGYRKNFGKRIQHEIPNFMVRLRNAAQEKKVTLKFLPYTFARRTKNTTMLNYKTKEIDWDIEWIFINADGLKIHDNRVSESQRLASFLNKYLVKQEDSLIQEKLQYYQSADMPGIKLLLKAEQKPGKKFYELDANLTLSENLQNKIIIEYPTIHVVLKGHESGYNIIDSDEEEMDVDSKTGNEVVDSIINNAENEESLFKSLKNLLFISEYSDDELSGHE